MMRQSELVQISKYKVLFQKSISTAFSRKYLYNCLKTVQELEGTRKQSFPPKKTNMTRNDFQHQRNALSLSTVWIEWQFEDKTMSISGKKGLNFDRNATILLKIFVLNPMNMKNYFWLLLAMSSRGSKRKSKSVSDYTLVACSMWPI